MLRAIKSNTEGCIPPAQMYGALWESIDCNMLAGFERLDPQKTGLRADAFIDFVAAGLLRVPTFSTSTLQTAALSWRTPSGALALRTQLKDLLCFGEDLTWDFFVSHLADVLAGDEVKYMQRFRHKETLRFSLTSTGSDLCCKVFSKRSLEGRAKEVMRVERENAMAVVEKKQVDTVSCDARHTEPVSAVYYFPHLLVKHGCILAVSKSNVAIIRDARDYTELIRLPPTTLVPIAVAHTPCANFQLAVSYPDLSLRLYSVHEKRGCPGRVRYIFPTPSPLHCLLYSTKHARLISGSREGELSLWNIKDVSVPVGTHIKEISATDLMLAHETVEKRELQADYLRIALLIPTEPLSILTKILCSLSPLLGLTNGQNIYLIEARGRAALYLAALAQIKGMSLSAFADIVKSCVRQERLEVSDTNREGLMWSQAFHTDTITALALNHKRNVITSSKDSTICIIDLELKTKLYQLTGHPKGIVNMDITLEHMLLICAGYCTCPLVWDLKNPFDRPVQLVDGTKPHTGRIMSVACCGDLPQLVSIDTAGLIKVWDTRRLGQLRVAALQNIDTTLQLPISDRSSHTICGMIYIKLLNMVYIAGRNVCFYEAEKHTNAYTAADVSEGGITFASYCAYFDVFITISARKVSVWDTKTGIVSSVLTVGEDPEDSVTCACFFPDSPFGVLGTSLGKLSLIRTASGEDARSVDLHHGHVVVAAVGCKRKKVSYILTVDRSGLIVVSSKGLRPLYTHRLPGVKPTCATNCPTTGFVAIGTDTGAVFLVDPDTLQARGVVARFQVKGELCAVSGMSQYPCLVSSDSSGDMTMTLLKAQSTYCLAQWTLPTKVRATEEASAPAHFVKSIASSTVTTAFVCINDLVFAGDQAGCLTLWDTSGVFAEYGITPVATTNAFRRAALAEVDVAPSCQVFVSPVEVWTRSITDSEIISLTQVEESCKLLAACGDGRVFIVSALDGHPITALCQGRGSQTLRGSECYTTYAPYSRDEVRFGDAISRSNDQGDGSDDSDSGKHEDRGAEDTLHNVAGLFAMFPKKSNLPEHSLAPSASDEESSASSEATKIGIKKRLPPKARLRNQVHGPLVAEQSVQRAPPGGATPYTPVMHSPISFLEDRGEGGCVGGEDAGRVRSVPSRTPAMVSLRTDPDETRLGAARNKCETRPVHVVLEATQVGHLTANAVECSTRVPTRKEHKRVCIWWENTQYCENR